MSYGRQICGRKLDPTIDGNNSININ